MVLSTASSPVRGAIAPAAMRPSFLQPRRIPWALCVAIVAGSLAAPAAAQARTPVSPVGSLAQLSGKAGCVVDESKPGKAGCTEVRALRGPAPFLGSRAVVISPDGRNLYVASSKSNAIAIFTRNASTGALTQPAGAGGCISQDGIGGCATGVGLVGPNSVAVSPDGTTVYATAVGSSAVTVLHRDATTGALAQAQDGSGCIADAATTGCVTGRALKGADVVVVSPDGANVYVGAFFGNAVAVFTRDTTTGTLTQPADTTGCLAAATAGCATGLALLSPEGLAISPDGATVYVAAAASSAVDILVRNPSTGALSQAGDGTGCIVNTALAGCSTGVRIGGANAVAVSPAGDDVYATSLFSNTVTSFTRSATSGTLTQQTGTNACVIYVLAVGCSLGRAMSAPEGIVVAPDGATAYAASFTSGAINVLERNTAGSLIQKRGRAGCQATSATPGCVTARAMQGVSSLAVSADGKFLYGGSNKSNAVTVFKRVPASR